VINIPADRLEERINEVLSRLSLLIARQKVSLLRKSLEAVDKLANPGVRCEKLGIAG
jgi:hypothetical protein